MAEWVYKKWAFFFFGVSGVGVLFFYLHSVGLQDLHFIVEQIDRNHPGVCNPLDPQFNMRFRKAAQIAEKDLASCFCLPRKKVLNDFVASLEDNHCGIAWRGGGCAG